MDFNFSPIIDPVFNFFNIVRCAGVVCAIGNSCVAVRSFKQNGIVNGMGFEIVPERIIASVIVPSALVKLM